MNTTEKSKTHDKKSTAEYNIKNYRFVVESKFDDNGQKIEDIIIKLAVDAVKKEKTA